MTEVLIWTPGVVLPPIALTPAINAAITDALTPVQTVALTAWAEARSRFEPGRGWVPNPIEALADVVNVIDNRVQDRRWKAMGHKGACLAWRQFSCWDARGGPDNYWALLERAQRLLAGELPSNKLLGCLALAEGCLAGSMVDTLNTATHYYSPASMVPPGRVPAWVKGAMLTAERFGHRFYAKVT